MNWLKKHLSFKADMIITLLNGLVVIGSVFVLNGLIARLHGLDVLGEFLLIKRTLSAGVGILLVGMNVGLPNYLSRNFNRAYADNSFILFLVVSVPLSIFLLGGLLWFGIAGFYQEHFWLYILFSISISAQFMAYALYRGYMNMLGANVLQLLGTAIIPILIFSLVSSLNDGLFWIGGSVLTIMILAFLSRNRGVNLRKINLQKSKELLQYGFERVPSFVSQFILLAGIPIILAQSVNFESVAYFNSSLSLVRLSLLFTHPIGMVLLPRIANKIASGSNADIKHLLGILLKAGTIFSIIGTTYIYINASIILQFWLGTVSDSGVIILRFTILALPFYSFSGLTRSPIDAVSKRGYNSLVYGLGAVTMVTIFLIGQKFQADLLSNALFSFLISHIVTGLASAFFMKKLYAHQIWDLKLIRDIIISIVTMLLVHYLVSLVIMPDFTRLIITSVIYFVIGIILIRLTNTGWLAELKAKIYA